MTTYAMFLPVGRKKVKIDTRQTNWNYENGSPVEEEEVHSMGIAYGKDFAGCKSEREGNYKRNQEKESEQAASERVRGARRSAWRRTSNVTGKFWRRVADDREETWDWDGFQSQPSKASSDEGNRHSKEQPRIRFHRRKMSAHALLKMTRDLFRAMSLALRQKCRLRWKK